MESLSPEARAVFLTENPRDLDLLQLASEHASITDEQAPLALRQMSLALIAQAADQYDEGHPFLLRMAVRRDGMGPIQVLLNAHIEVVAGAGRACVLHRPLLLVPGILVTTEPSDLILLGRRLSAREAVEAYGKGLFIEGWAKALPFIEASRAHLEEP